MDHASLRAAAMRQEQNTHCWWHEHMLVLSNMPSFFVLAAAAELPPRRPGAEPLQQPFERFFRTAYSAPLVVETTIFSFGFIA